MTGDPFLYASGPEEAQACVKAGVGFEIVPGVSSVTAVPAYAGVPLTDSSGAYSMALLARKMARRGGRLVMWATTTCQITASSNAASCTPRCSSLACACT